MTGTFIDLEFDTARDEAPLGDIASSLVTLNDLLRDLGAMAADPSTIEFREIQVVAIEMRRPLTIKLSLRAIAPEAVTAFQELCRNIIRSRDIAIENVLQVMLNATGHSGDITEKETARLRGHIEALQNAQVRLKRVVVRKG